MRHWIPTLLACATLTCAQMHRVFTGHTIPNPQIDFDACGMNETSFVCDPHGILTDEERVETNMNMIKLQSETKRSIDDDGCSSKGLTAFVIILFKLFDNRRASESDIDNFATTALLRFKGDVQCRKDVVIAISKEDRRAFIKPGTKVGLSAGAFRRIILGRPVAAFREGNFASAILAIKQGLVSDYNQARRADGLRLARVAKKWMHASAAVRTLVGAAYFVDQ